MSPMTDWRYWITYSDTFTSDKEDEDDLRAAALNAHYLTIYEGPGHGPLKTRAAIDVEAVEVEAIEGGNEG